MRPLFTSLILGSLILATAASGQAQTPDEARNLKAENEDLRKQLSNLAKENELLKREIELLKREAKPTPDQSPLPTEDSAPLATTSQGGVDYEIVKCVRKGTSVTFTFSAVCYDENRVLGGGDEFRKLSLLLITPGGVELTNGRTIGGPTRLISLKKGVPSKFQMTYIGVAKEITHFDEVIINENFKGPVTFQGVKIDTK